MSSRVRGLAALGASSVALMAATPAPAQTSGDIAELRQMIEALRVEQQRSIERIVQLETELAAARNTDAPAPGQARPVDDRAGRSDAVPQAGAGTGDLASAAAPVNPAGGSAPGFAPAPAASRLTLNGDLRLRYEVNSGDRDARNRDRGVLRARLRAAYAVNPWLTLGGQIATGDADDPNSTDISLSNFDDDLDASVDQAYARLTFGKLQIVGGKIPQPFTRTELVWDGDVSPQGLSVSYALPLGGGTTLKANGLYFLIDESVAGPNSDMVGGQLALETAPGRSFKFELAAGYYDYQLRSTAGGDIGDFRTNRFVGGRYLSDFDLIDVIAAVSWNGLGDRWPVRIVGDYVHNFGATAGADGLGADLLVGRTGKAGDWRLGYGYAQTGVDAVLAAFSHDNTNIATNYVQHSLALDYTLSPNLILNATYYRYRPKDATFAGANQVDDWLDRLRLNFLVNF